MRTAIILLKISHFYIKLCAHAQFVAKKMPFDFFSIDDDGIAYSQFKDKYEQVCHLIQQGHELPKIDAPHRIKPARNLEVGEGYLNQIKQYIGV